MEVSLPAEIAGMRLQSVRGVYPATHPFAADTDRMQSRFDEVGLASESRARHLMELS